MFLGGFEIRCLLMQTQSTNILGRSWNFGQLVNHREVQAFLMLFKRIRLLTFFVAHSQLRFSPLAFGGSEILVFEQINN